MNEIKPTVFIIDDNYVLCEALYCLFESSGKFNTAIYHEGQSFLNDYQTDKFGCILIDVMMPGLSGLDVLIELKKRNNKIPVIVITGHGDVPMAVKALQLGAKDFLTKPFHSEQLLDKIEQLIKSSTDQHFQYLKYQALYSKLTQRERDIMTKVTAGKLNKQIADELGIALKTVELHRSNLMRKLEVRNLAGLIHLANMLK